MGRKKHVRSASISSHDRSSSTISSFGQSSNESQTSPSKDKYRRLSKKDLKKLIKLEKQIEREEDILRKAREKKAKLILKKMQPKKQIQQKEQKNEQVFTEDLSDKRKLFVTGIAQKYSYEEVMQEMGKALKSILGVTGYRVKRKEGCPTYAFVDFSTHQDAKQGKQKLQNKRLFGEKMAIYYSQDENKINIKVKQCFQCKGYGHFARECQLRKPEVETTQQNKNKDKNDSQLDKFDNEDRVCVKLEENLYQRVEPISKRVVRDKFRLSRLLGQN